MVESYALKEVIIKYANLEDLEPNEIDDSDPLFGDEGLGLDSVDSIELVLAIEKEFGVKITDPNEYTTIFANTSSLLKYINENI